MKFKNISCLLLASLLVSNVSFAEPSKQDLAVEYLELSQTRESIESSIDTYATQIAASQPNVKVEDLRELFNEMMGWGVLEKPISEMVVKHLTSKELKDINEFYKTTSGKSLADKTPIMSSEISALIMENIQKVMQASAQ